jgi:hypothetical protein
MMDIKQATNIANDVAQITQMEGLLVERKERKQARMIMMKELRAQQANENDEEWQIRVQILRLKYKYDHETVLSALNTVMSNVEESIKTVKTVVGTIN